MNAYLVRTREEREYVEPILDDGTGPSLPYWPTGIFVAATPAQAKSDALRVWSGKARSGVYPGDWLALRVRLLWNDVALLSDVRRGELPDAHGLSDPLWARVHEVLDHDGNTCDCREEVTR